MKRKPLIQANPYLKDPANQQRLLSIAVSSSTAIEGIQVCGIPKVLGFQLRF
jgi:hypothetical protein